MNKLEKIENANVELTKESTENEILQYFQKVFELTQSGEEFPVDFDLVYPLVYLNRRDAVAALKRDFIENVDYSPSACSPQRCNGRFTSESKETFKLTVGCMEHFVARKSKPVFEVYRRVFHKVANETREVVMARALIYANETIEEQQKKIGQQQTHIKVQQKFIGFQSRTLKEQEPYVDFAKSIETSTDGIPVATFAKILRQNGVKIGGVSLFAWFRDNEYLIKREGRQRNMPTQKSIETGLFEVKESVNGDSVYCTTLVSGKGQMYFMDKFLNKKVYDKV